VPSTAINRVQKSTLIFNIALCFNRIMRMLGWGQPPAFSLEPFIL
jgi:hypothetical protein